MPRGDGAKSCPIGVLPLNCLCFVLFSVRNCQDDGQTPSGCRFAGELRTVLFGAVRNGEKSDAVPDKSLGKQTSQCGIGREKALKNKRGVMYEYCCCRYRCKVGVIGGMTECNSREQLLPKSITRRNGSAANRVRLRQCVSRAKRLERSKYSGRRCRGVDEGVIGLRRSEDEYQSGPGPKKPWD